MWLAKDKNQVWWTYSLEPRPYTDTWSGGGSWKIYKGTITRGMEEVDWEQSLRELDSPDPVPTQLDRIEARLIAIEEMLKGGQL